MNSLIVLALLAFSAVNAAPKAQNFDSLSDQQKQQLSMQLEQQIKNAGFDVSKLPHDSNGNLDISKLPKDSNGNIELSQIVNGGGGGSGNGGGEIDINGGGGGSGNGRGNININGRGGRSGNGGGNINVNGGNGGNGGISLRIEQQLKNAGVDVSKLPHDSNGNLDLSQLPKDANGNVEISQIVNGDGGVNVKGGGRIKGKRNGGVNVKGGGGVKGKGDGGVDGGLNGDCGFYEGQSGPGGSEEGRYGPGGQYGPHQLKPSETGGKYDAYEAQFKTRDAKIGVVDVGAIVCNEGGLQNPEGKILNGTQITLSRLTDKLRDLIIKILNKKAAAGGKKNIFGRAACEADKVIRVFLDKLRSLGATVVCGLTKTVTKILKAFKSKNILAAIIEILEYFIEGTGQAFAKPPEGIADTVKQALHGVGKILNIKGKY